MNFQDNRRRLLTKDQDSISCLANWLCKIVKMSVIFSEICHQLWWIILSSRRAMSAKNMLAILHSITKYHLIDLTRKTNLHSYYHESFTRSVEETFLSRSSLSLFASRLTKKRRPKTFYIIRESYMIEYFSQSSQLRLIHVNYSNNMNISARGHILIW